MTTVEIRMKIWMLTAIVINYYSGNWPNAKINFPCNSTNECNVTLNKLPFCCGTCDNSYCCDIPSSSFNISQCLVPETSGISKTWMLGAIIGGMIGAFVVGILMHTLMQKCVRKLYKRTGEGNETATDSQPPLYADLYNENSLPGYSQKSQSNVEYDEPKSLDSTPKKIDDTEKETLAPPSYKDLFFQNTDETEI